MEYRGFEATLAKLHGVTADGMSAFRARLRVLRSMGVPKLPRVGKGARVKFSRAEIADVHLALTLGESGLPPARIIEAVRCTEKLRVWPPHRPERTWLVMSRRSNHECRERLDEDVLLCLEIVEETDLLRHLETPSMGCSTGTPSWTWRSSPRTSRRHPNPVRSFNDGAVRILG